MSTDGTAKVTLAVDLDPTDFVPYRTGDGSLTLYSGSTGVFHHSVHGAVQESTHVYIRSGLEAVQKERVRILEVGLGTGINLLLTWIRCLEGKCMVDYSALEPDPLSKAQLEELGHCTDLGWPGLHAEFIKLMTGPINRRLNATGGMTFRRSALPVQKFSEHSIYDVIYYDAFGPRTHPGMWTLDVLQRMFAALVHGGALVTYCAKGSVRRTLKEAGFHVERLPGPVGKREMFKATKLVEQ